MIFSRSVLFAFLHALFEQKHAGCSSFISFFLLVPIPLLISALFIFLSALFFSHCAHWFCSFWEGCFSFLLLLLTITNDDIRSMHGGAQYGLRISAFWLLASGSCAQFASVLWFCIAFRISSALCSLLSLLAHVFFFTAHVIIIWRIRITLLIQC
jgi:hypothetical protein